MDHTVSWEGYRSFGTSPTARSALRVSLALLELVDPSMKGAVARNATRLQKQCDRLKAALDRRGEPTASVDGRPVDLRADRAWGALQLRLQAWATLAGDASVDQEKANRASELLATLFADGMEFLKLPYPEQELEMDRLLRLIDKASLEKELIALAGKEFVQAIESVQQDYSKMVAAMLSRDEEKERVVTIIREVARAAENYATSVLGTVDEEDPKSVAHVRKLLAPLANHRLAVEARSGAKNATNEEPTPAEPAKTKDE